MSNTKATPDAPSLGRIEDTLCEAQIQTNKILLIASFLDNNDSDDPFRGDAALRDACSRLLHGIAMEIKGTIESAMRDVLAMASVGKPQGGQR